MRSEVNLWGFKSKNHPVFARDPGGGAGGLPCAASRRPSSCMCLHWWHRRTWQLGGDNEGVREKSRIEEHSWDRTDVNWISTNCGVRKVRRCWKQELDRRDRDQQAEDQDKYWTKSATEFRISSSQTKRSKSGHHRGQHGKRSHGKRQQKLEEW